MITSFVSLYVKGFRSAFTYLAAYHVKALVRAPH